MAHYANIQWLPIFMKYSVYLQNWFKGNYAHDKLLQKVLYAT